MQLAKNFTPSLSRDKLDTFLSLVKKHDLDARLVIWSPDPTWTDLQKDKYIVNWGGNAAWIIPAVTYPSRHQGMMTSLAVNVDGIHYVASHMDGKKVAPVEDMCFTYESVLFAQVRGFKRSMDPRLVVVTAQESGWEATLLKALGKLTPITQTLKPYVFWDAIEDVQVI